MTAYTGCAIEQWFATGATTSPRTNQPLASHALIPNHTVRSLIAAELEKREQLLS